MSAAVCLPPVELESQNHILHRLQFLTRFSSNLIQVTGPEGAGKSFISQQYLSHWAFPQSRKALLICHPQQSDEQHRRILLEQLYRGAVFNEQDSLAQSICHLHSPQAEKLLLVIDDAHRLSPVLVAELLALVQEVQRDGVGQVNVLLFSLMGRLDKYLSQASHGQGMLPVEVELLPFDEAEAHHFTELMLTHLRSDANVRRIIKMQLAATAAFPGSIIGLLHQEKVEMSTSSSRSLSSLALLFTLLLILGASVVFWFFPTNGQSDPQVISVLDEDGPMEIDNVKSQPGNSVALPDFKETKPTTSTVIVDGVEDTKPMPPELFSDGMTVGRKDDRDRVVLPGEVVDSIITEQEMGGDGRLAVATSIEQQIKPAIEAVTLDVDEALAAQVSEQEAVVVDEMAADPVELVLSDAELSAIAPSNYALQLAAMRSLSATAQFIESIEMSDDASVYQTLRNGETWYIVVTGAYASVELARTAINRLPAKAQAVQPWVKAYRQIHTEIEQVN
ncbi:SPOR domain-containing protein [Thaumasiovibrio sp. DFM-14]|uniref:SPOR domain-containing protein n=1 Tax=Thaumasiovibrio sp. DFM-14 TaxID=3384792 RepID=UPI0039A3757B